MFRKLFVVFVLLMVSFATFGKGSKTDNRQVRGGISIKSYSPDVASGILFGWHHIYYNSKHFFIGGAGYTGQLGRTSETGTFSYGGLLTGFSVSGKTVGAEMGLLVGGGGGKIITSTQETNSAGVSGRTEISDGGILLEPSLGMTFKTSELVTINLGGSYIFMLNSQDFSGITGTLRFDFSLENF